MFLILLAAILLLLVILIPLIFFRIYITFEFSYIEDEQRLAISIAIFRFRIINKTLQLTQESLSSNFLDDLESLESFLDNDPSWKQWKDAFVQFIRKIQLHYLDWSTSVGTGDAASTGVVTGMLWSLKSSILAFLGNNMILIQPPEIDVRPVYQGEEIQTNVQCMISIKMTKAIQAFFKARRILK